MTQLRCTLVALLGLTLAACGSDDPTVVALNISYGEGIVGMDSVRVLIEQNGETFTDTFDAPLQPGTIKATLPDGGVGTADIETQVPDPGYFKRYDLSGFKDGEADLTVDLLSPGGAVLFTEETTFKVLENRTVAAYANFVIEPSTETPDTSGETSAPVSSGSSSAPASSAPDTGDTSSTTGEATSATGASTDDAGSSEPVVDDAGTDTAVDTTLGLDASAGDAG
jgi:hypothetical protein